MLNPYVHIPIKHTMPLTTVMVSICWSYRCRYSGTFEPAATGPFFVQPE